MDLITATPESLLANPWNTNHVSEENQKKLDASIVRLGAFKPIIARELENGELQIIGGEHRRDAAIRLGKKQVEVLNLGRMSDKRAKEIGLADNERYGEDDSFAFAALLGELGTAEELSSFLPLSSDDFDSLSSSYGSIDLDSLDVEEEDELPKKEPIKSGPTHRVIRFKVQIEDAERLSKFMDRVMTEQGFTASDAITNAGDALIHTIRKLW